MKLNEIIARVDAFQARTNPKVSDRALSMAITGKEDTVRNWRRRIEKGEGDRSAQGDNIQKLLDITGGDHWIGGNPGPGFAERDARPWRPKPTASELELIRALAPTARHPTTYRLTRGAPGFNLSAGDVVIVDLHRTPAPKDIVVVNMTDPEVGAATTLLRRYLPPYVIPDNPDDEPHLLDGIYVAIFGPVVASFRSPELTEDG